MTRPRRHRRKREPDYPEPIDDTPENIAAPLFPPRRPRESEAEPSDGYSAL